ncbi:MAG: 50S ribosomal protein L32 [Candidatus Doudnabacteria bacterium RIFCSPHIGHO2_02_FULL_48_21]|uniref:Large ribosomal subunit protein bL32 n=1 Tax=Candidatus Doudnabacteria bacterium RIFCSPLOWO2_02_FULL_48_13 TaxID=1817845 RepID=A0A1F5QC97_9BACT|nr:MAG: 50S ribosomal protein L32 [Candidatus Doudnabacteria bacterium RIFCSPHIGHO2_01_FULL_48_180]OGE93535.1 MAG: 50S ribosomal protein L32 [Candidatus Doudnabacteria bacterium RIFCSPHIGHO2_02_FULL_48_21]OGE96311.1 MAG: 50S ribosomal protein L32 [Candidatus Doudnabacteria bacterium RIFCSPLOWO2_01_FULL_48_57]OGE99805.1 MAG: 50S ribosomal protein L32 [Candidatus Doudnabacteria bacterium RIFCSPLOWO2_02_FULL_48_13]OGF00537.1 MAG: 50S ribosomal protein L32 [Candidatus Doudnabacteria bacterium RIFCS
MGVPRQRKTHSERNQRRSHHALKKTQVAKCKNCGAAVMPHDICGACGFYRGTEVVKKSPVTAKSAK